ncbi:MAG: glycosyltransferase family 4 protein [Chloroflexi bacterium]|nr:glycosyltransferase family 4 protein [Chloroflexota bacterium]
MKNILIIANGTIFLPEGGLFKAGGIQTYAKKLIELIQHEMGWRCTIIQQAPYEKTELYLGATINYVKIPGVLTRWGTESGITSYLLNKYICRHYKNLFDLIIYLGPSGEWPELLQPCICIQHGIYDDIPNNNKITFRLKRLIKNLLVNKEYTTFKNANQVVCVDTNFINSYRLKFPWRNTSHLNYIPNFTELASHNFIDSKWSSDCFPEKIIVCFPRRFEAFRGVLLTIDAWKAIYERHPNVEFIFLGWGTYEREVNELCKQIPRTYCYHTNHNKAQEIISQAHIVLIPSLGSEGTSLSCIEAMGRGSLVIATNVGGLGNIIIPNYNGLFINPTVDELIASLEYTLENYEIAKKMVSNAYNVALVSFSEHRWKEKMGKVILNVINSGSHKK